MVDFHFHFNVDVSMETFIRDTLEHFCRLMLGTHSKSADLRLEVSVQF